MPAAFYIMPDYGEEAETMPSIHYQYTVDGDDFTLAGEASSALKQTLKLMNLDADIIRRCAIAMYEGEINMVIHANGGIIDVDIFPDKIVMVLTDHGPGIPDVPLAMQEGYSTAGEEVLNRPSASETEKHISSMNFALTAANVSGIVHITPSIQNGILFRF